MYTNKIVLFIINYINKLFMLWLNFLNYIASNYHYISQYNNIYYKLYQLLFTKNFFHYNK